MEYVKLPGIDKPVSRICLGCWQMNNNQGNIQWDAQPVEVSKAIVDKCFEMGINFFDTAEGYAGSEEALGQCLKGRRDKAVIATKFGFRDGPATPAYSAEQIEEAVTKSLKKLDTDYIDLLQVHFPSFVANFDEAIAQLDKEIADGRIKNYGVCNFGPKNLQLFRDKGFKMISNQIGYNLLWRSQEHEVIPMCKENNITILAYSPLQHGLLTGKYKTVDDVPAGRRRGKLFAPERHEKSRHGQPGCEKEVFEAIAKMEDICKKAGVPMGKAAMSWLYQHETKPIIIVGCSTPEQVVLNADIVKLSDDVMKQLTEATEEVKVKIGKHLDQWATPDRCE